MAQREYGKRGSRARALTSGLSLSRKADPLNGIKYNIKTCRCAAFWRYCARVPVLAPAYRGITQAVFIISTCRASSPHPSSLGGGGGARDWLASKSAPIEPLRRRSRPHGYSYRCLGAARAHAHSPRFRQLWLYFTLPNACVYTLYTDTCDTLYLRALLLSLSLSPSLFFLCTRFFYYARARS